MVQMPQLEVQPGPIETISGHRPCKLPAAAEHMKWWNTMQEAGLPPCRQSWCSKGCSTEAKWSKYRPGFLHSPMRRGVEVLQHCCPCPLAWPSTASLDQETFSFFIQGKSTAPAAERDGCACNFCEGSSLPLFVTHPEGSVSCSLSLHKASAQILRWPRLSVKPHRVWAQQVTC